MQRLFKQFSFPGGIPSHVAPETPGSIHEGGELGYALSHAYGAAFDNPDLIVACVVGDGEAETGPLATSWHSNKFLNPARDGAVLPILHLNGYKIANPTLPGAHPARGARSCFEGYGYEPVLRRGRRARRDAPGDGRDARRRAWPRSERIQTRRAGATAFRRRPRWPMIVLRTPKGWTGPTEVDGKKSEGYWRSHQVPMGDMDRTRRTSRILEEWMKSYRPEELFDDAGPAPRRSSPRWRRPATGAWAPTRTPTAASCCRTCGCRTSATTRSTCRAPGGVDGRGHARAWASSSAT